MGYTFRIGNATPAHSKEYFPELDAKWGVESVSLDCAPAFPNDNLSQHCNSRHPSYTVWAEFCRDVGLYSFFYDDSGHLKAGHPGCIGITQEDVSFVSDALARRVKSSKLPPGFEDRWDYQGPPNYDYNLARLFWLEWWMRWAIENCETPAIQNF